MKKLFLLLMALLPMMAIAQVKFVPSDFESAKAKAKQLGKELLVDVIRGKQDPAMIAKTFSNKEVSKFINKNFYAVTIDMNKPENKDFGQYLYSLMYPCVVFYSNRGEQLESTNWYSTSNGKANILDLAKKSMETAAVKRANTKSIEFKNLDYAQALELAKKEGKLVFVDNYTSWCRPCKQMEMDVFTLNSVAEYYNENFVCIKLDADKDPHKVAKTFGVRGYPGYLFIDGEGDLVYEAGGFTPEKAFIGYGQEAKRILTDDKEVKFENITLDEAIAKAQKSNKLIYVDLSATWCGPCKTMKKTVFTSPKVARIMNNKFVNLYIECDIDKATADMYKEKYGYSAFPTHLIINSKGELVHKLVGSMDANGFITSMKDAMSNKGLAYYNETYKKGERGAEFVTKYLAVLGDANEKELASKVANEYLLGLSMEQLATKENFSFLKKLVNDLDHSLAKKVMENKAFFVEKLSAQEVDRYINGLWTGKAHSFVKKGATPSFDKAGYDAFMVRLAKESGLSTSEVDNTKFSSLVINAENMKDWKTYVKLTSDKIKKDGEKVSMMSAYNWGLRINKNVEDKKVRAKFATVLEGWVKKASAKDSSSSMWMPSTTKLIEDLRK